MNTPCLHFPILLLDMNGTFMFGGDRFGSAEDCAATYRALGGKVSDKVVNAAVEAAFAYLNVRYTDRAYRDAFPSVKEALAAVPESRGLTARDLDLIALTFARHEVGVVPQEYACAVQRLARGHRLGLVADIWADRQVWTEELARAGLLDLFEVLVFSSDSGSVKPSPEPFRSALRAMGASVADAVVIGDSSRRDGGGATAAGLPFVLVGGERHSAAMKQVPSLLTLA